MKKIITIITIATLVSACNQEKKEVVVKEEKVEVVTETQKKEPTKPEETEIWEPKPKTVTVSSDTGIPSDAIVLFDGTNFDHWISSVDSTNVKWNLNKDGSMTVKDKTGDIQTKQNFGDVQLHIEWKSSTVSTGSNQSKSNSGVFLQNRYEVQVLDNNDNDTYVNGQVASVYKQSIPLAKASSPTGEWNTYDIIYHAPKFDTEGNKTQPGTITVLHNGVLVQDHYVLEGTTEYIGWPKNNSHGKGPIKLQDHGDKSGVSFKNIWVREL
jgi:hypothetical protein